MDNQVTVTHTTNYQLEQAGSMMDLATNLAQFIKDRKLSQSIQGREYVLVEGWQYCGGMLGVLPIITATENLSTAEEIIYTAKCDLINIKTGVKVGGAESVCSNKEKGKKYFEAYAIQSMAQTRCIGKAYRLMIGWLMKAAGYEATPAEEMDSVKEQENEIKAAAIEYLQSESREEALKVWNKYPQYKANPIFIKAAKALGALYPKPEETVAEEVKEPVERTYREDGKAVVNGKTYEEATPEEREAAKGAPDKITAPDAEIKPLPEGVELITPAQRKTINELIPKVPAAMAKKATAWLNSGNPITMQEAAEKILKLAEEKSKAKANAA